MGRVIVGVLLLSVGLGCVLQGLLAPETLPDPEGTMGGGFVIGIAGTFFIAFGYRSLVFRKLVGKLQPIIRKMDEWQFEDGEAVLRSYRAEAHRIGVKLNRWGGKPLMLRAHRESGGGRSLEIAWNGIGDWLG